jgi:hypothetical protein
VSEAIGLANRTGGTPRSWPRARPLWARCQNLELRTGLGLPDLEKHRVGLRDTAAGIILLAATQMPSSDVIRTSLHDLFGIRWALRCSTSHASDTVLSRGPSGRRRLDHRRRAVRRRLPGRRWWSPMPLQQLLLLRRRI